MPILPGEPVYFLSLELQNVGAFGPESLLIDLSNGYRRPAMWTLILGENGVGKTTALECLLGLTPLPQGIVLPDGPSIHARTWSSNGQYNRLAHDSGKAPLTIAALVEFIGDGAPLSGAFPIRYTIQGETKEGSRLSLEAFSPLPHTSDWPGTPVYSYSARRDIDFDEARFPAASVREQPIDASQSLGIYPPISVDGWLLAMDHARLMTKSQRASDDHERLISLLVTVLPGVRDIRQTIPTDRGESVRMEYLTDDGWVPYAGLGLGYKSVMGLIGDLVYRLYTAYPDSPEPLKEPAVVLIDEIDLHLHPRWQRDIIGTLSERFPRVQFIATAHSPLMVQAAAGHNLALLYRDPETKQVRVDNDVDRIANWRLDQIVTSELFGVPSAVRPQLDPEIRRRNEILAKETLTDADRDEVRRIEAQLGGVPLGSTPEERRTNDLLRRTLEALEKKAAG